VALEAKRLLAESDLAVAQIGARLGFSEATNFGRFFSRIVGASPGQFRVESHRAAAAAAEARADTPPAQILAAALAKAGAART
jgi:AraC-like DNA-binding protein